MCILLRTHNESSIRSRRPDEKQDDNSLMFFKDMWILMFPFYLFFIHMMCFCFYDYDLHNLYVHSSLEYKNWVLHNIRGEFIFKNKYLLCIVCLMAVRLAFLWDVDKTKWWNGFSIEFRQSFAKETFSYDEYLKK